MHGRLTLSVACVLLTTAACGFGQGPTAPDWERLHHASAPLPAPSGPIVIPVTGIMLGDTIRGTIELDDPVCDPVGWDARSPCKRFQVAAPRDGSLTAILKAIDASVTEDVIDFLLECPGHAVAYSGGGAEQRLSMPVLAGQPCLITINAYPALLPMPAGVDFELWTDMETRESS